MKTITPEIETEAAIWAEGTSYTAADILRAYREHLGTAAEPIDIQRFCETVLGIAPDLAGSIKAIEEALGDYLCSNSQPCAAAVYFDAGESRPWRIADDGNSESFATVSEAVEAAKAWRQAMSE